MLTGCGMGPVATSSAGTMAINGVVHGGQNPVSNSSIQLYTVGTNGNASPATPMLINAVSSDEAGNFNISADYNCGMSGSIPAVPTGSNQVYIVATGGNPGFGEGTHNDRLVLMAALGDCSKLATAKFVEINEVTTAAAVWSLAPFMTASPAVGTTATNIGASSTNASGIQNAFLDAALLADTSTGLPATLDDYLSVETDKLTAFADAIASCVNSDGTSGCDKLRNAATSTGVNEPADTLTAALDIVTHPGTNVAAVFAAIDGFAPFTTSLSKAPNDWTMSLTIIGTDPAIPGSLPSPGGLESPDSVAIDAEGNVWVAGYSGPLSVFGPQGTPLNDAGFGAGDIGDVDAVAVDSAGDIWVTNYNGGGNGVGTVTEFFCSDPAAGPVACTSQDYGSGVYYPAALSTDTKGNVFIANEDDSSGTIYSSTGTLSYAAVGADLMLSAHPYGIAADGSGGFWLSEDNASIAHISPPTKTDPNDQLLSNPACCVESYGLALDADGTVWVADYHGGADGEGAFAEVATDSLGHITLPISGSKVGGIHLPAFVVVDAGQNVWISNFRGKSITEIAGNHTTVPGGTALSPSQGLYGTVANPLGGYGRDVPLDNPLGVAPDRSGNLWVTSEGTNALVMFFGLATPTVTPVQPVPTAP